MKKGHRKHNPNLIRTKRSYTFAEAAEILKVHLRTVQGWRRAGLGVLDETARPYLIPGAGFRQFLKEKRRKMQCPLGPQEFFCVRCQQARHSLPKAVSTEITNKRLGKISFQAVLRGICEVCGGSLVLFTSDRKLEELRQNKVNQAKQETRLSGGGDSSANADITEVKKCTH